MQLYFNPTRRNREDDLNIFENGTRPKMKHNLIFRLMKDDLIVFKLKTTSIVFLMKDDLIFSKWKTTYFFHMEDKKKKVMQPKTIKSQNNAVALTIS
jgi:hypothetical protein